MLKRNTQFSRRQALTLAGSGLASAAFAGPVFANTPDVELKGALRTLAGKFFFSSENPGRWKGKEKGHSPLIKVEKDGSNALIRAAVRHPMDHDHFIIKHILMDQNFDFMAEQVFDVNFDMPRSRFEVSGYSGQFYVVSLCNLHDNWINVATI
ncbi:MAG: desulfoferrodoxin family protein [Sneathiella sp.]|uniref:desulfoferrodoxin family protein n=1 Tax=Sneathiella sp. TaxID=1964365 RepID=UPI0030034161